MAMFSMFLNAPPASTPVNLVYFEKRPFGPYGQAAGEVSTENGFSNALWLQVSANAAASLRGLRAVWDGWLRVAGVQEGFAADDPTAPLVVELSPGPNQALELRGICAAQQIETPRRIRYHGIDPASLVAAVTTYFHSTPSLRVLTPGGGGLGTFDPNAEQLIGLFLAGSLSVPLVEAGLGVGQPLGTVSTRNLADGLIGFGIELQTDPPMGVATAAQPPLPINRLDPVTFFNTLGAAKLRNGADAIDPAQRQNSWLDNVTKSRVLITFRDEWNAPLLSTSDAVVTGPGAGQSALARMDNVHAGTIVAPTGWHLYTCSIGVPGTRKLTPLNVNTAAADPLVIDTAGPAHRVVATVRPEDWFQPDFPSRPPAPQTDLARYTSGNIVDLLVDGIPAFKRLVGDLRELEDSSPSPGRFPDHFVLIGGWFLDADFEMIERDATSKLKRLLELGINSPHRLIVRALAWGMNVPHETLRTINLLDVPRGAGYVFASAVTFSDPRTSFHWKVTVVRNRFGTFASLGGIDINPNRVDDSDHLPRRTKYHDVHCRIQGPAVVDVTKAFLARWRIHTTEQGNYLDATDSITPTVTTPAEVPATHLVQITRTFQAGTGFGYQPWSPQGERTTWANLRNAISRAKRYIYIEEQYFVSALVRDAILDALNQPTAAGLEVVILIPDSADSSDSIFNPVNDKDSWDRVRYITLSPLMNDPRVHVFSIKDYYVHTKVTVVDDIFCTIGTSNINNRGMNFDAEINAWVLDGRTEAGVRKFARDLRTRLWAEHLGKPLNEGTFAELADIDRGLDILKNRRPANSRMAPYQPRNPGSDYPRLWFTVADPDGT
ncbi:hypothetical protein Rhe02_02910 [Rhizocola hellebori]|uniref:PLD phosphodiesterase domain-containing protein n=1 Tax=Rhizocola hellebori TaxID=1392758 RepID=A0A8J3Q2E4_9ACTN|nr:phospholipase D-like domain-containing protein [Rhizocola hellebori]GIH02224.1 hypothetical protein Rhe02_02910 [Rhizocola hellebori]